MGILGTQQVAVACAFTMWRNGYYPRTILNIGLSSRPELSVWRWLFPLSRVIAVDPRGLGRGTDKFYSAVAGDGSKSKAMFCLCCKSVDCRYPEQHFDMKVGELRAWILKDVISLDQMATDEPPPYFVWMDIEGGEMEALHGATAVLEQAHFVNVEQFEWKPGHIKSIEAFMKEAGFVPLIRHPTDDVLYLKRGRIPNNWRQMVRWHRRRRRG